MVYLIILVGVFIMGLAIINVVYLSKPHCKCDNPMQLRKSARIVDVTCKPVGGRYNRKYRTTVSFDDGFVYISHKTHVENMIVFRRISMDEALKNEILNDSCVAHDKAFKNKLNIK